MLGIIVIIVILGVIISGVAGSRNKTTEASGPDLSAGVSYLQSLESKDPSQVEATLKAYRQQEMQIMRDEHLAKLETGEISVWSLFDDYMLMGDSRVMGFDFYGFLDQDRVLAEKGDTILTLSEHTPEIVAANPSYLFISYGVNDVLGGMWASPEDYAADLAEIIGSIQSQLPDVKVFVNSILLAYGSSSSYSLIPDYNTALSEMCQELNNCYFVDNTSLCESYYSLYEGDGIHVSSSFYPHWATNMIMEVYDSELETEDLAA